MADAISMPRLSRRALVFLAIVGLHVGFVLVLNSGLAMKAVETVFQPIKTEMIEEQIDEEEAPPPPPPKIDIAPPPFVPPPDIAIDLPVETSSTTTAITATTQRPVVKPPPPKAVVRVAPKVNPRRPIGLPDYPAQSTRLGEEGLVKVAVCVDTDGKLSDIKLAEGSGFERLDQAALKHTARSSMRMLPGTEDGKPVRACTVIPYRFVIKKD